MKTLRPSIAILGATTRTRAGWQPDSQRGNRHQRGYGTAWEKLRQDVMRRDCGLCQPCARKGHTTQAHEVDHITPKAQGGTDDLKNLEAICTPCHREKTAREDSKGGG